MNDRELDALVAEKVMGRKLCPIHHSYTCCGRGNPRYSTDIAAAWQVVGKLPHLWFEIGREKLPNGRLTTGWEVIVYNDPDKLDRIYVSAVTAPRAICLAALRAVGVEVDDG